ncbi:MAG: (d)CMP kinase [Pseudomonadota bacterium]
MTALPQCPIARPMIIAIDGTLASGKGTIAKRLSAWYGLAHMDTGRLYRATGVAAMQKGLDLDDTTRVAALARTLDLNDYDEDDLRSAEAGQAASKVAALPQVRAALLDLQRAFAAQPKGAVLDGRDIGTVVCPHADVKLWVDADVRVRAERRWTELRAKGETLSLDEMVAQLEERDARDKTRKDAPMVAAADAVLIDTTHLSIDAAVDKARAAVEAAISQTP